MIRFQGACQVGPANAAAVRFTHAGGAHTRLASGLGSRLRSGGAGRRLPRLCVLWAHATSTVLNSI